MNLGVRATPRHSSRRVKPGMSVVGDFLAALECTIDRDLDAREFLALGRVEGAEDAESEEDGDDD